MYACEVLCGVGLVDLVLRGLSPGHGASPFRIWRCFVGFGGERGS